MMRSIKLSFRFRQKRASIRNVNKNAIFATIKVHTYQRFDEELLNQLLLNFFSGGTGKGYPGAFSITHYYSTYEFSVNMFFLRIINFFPSLDSYYSQIS